jgi:hypothetical protein
MVRPPLPSYNRQPVLGEVGSAALAVVVYAVFRQPVRSAGR